MLDPPELEVLGPHCQGHVALVNMVLVIDLVSSERERCTLVQRLNFKRARFQ